MVRVLVGTMLATARGDCTFEEFEAMLAGGAARSDAFETAPARGLCFVDVTWEPIDGLELPPRWRAGRAPELREPAHSSPGALPFSTAG
jgi:tRNA U38,U39,U40 pseudouridine synthase TruA